jgi:hypothetical protein
MGAERKCATVADRGSALCPYHSLKESERWADEYESRANDGQSFAAALDLPFLDAPLGSLTREERAGLGLYLERRYPLLEKGSA